MAMDDIVGTAKSKVTAQSRNRKPQPTGLPGETGLSLFRAAPALVVLAIMVADSGRFADPDLWGHIRFGQAVLNQGHLIQHDPYSYSAPGHLWLNHEWLSEVTMAWLYNRFGVPGLNLLKLVCATATVTFLAAAEAETAAPLAVQAAVLIAAAVIISPQLQFRPQMFTFALMSALLALLARRNYRGSSQLWLAVPILALWANLHGGFIVGLAALAAFSAAVTLKDRITGRRRQPVALWLTTALAALATLATPYGVGTWNAVAHALANPVTHYAILDWRPLVPALTAQWRAGGQGVAFPLLGVTMLAAFVLSVALAPNSDDVPLIAVAVLMIGAAFAALRNLTLAILATSVPLAHHLALALHRARESRKRPRTEASIVGARLGWASQLILLVFSFQVAWATGLFSKGLEKTVRCPTGAVSFMKQHHLQGNVLGEFDWGEYLIWHLAPQSKVFIDGRYDTVYPANVIEDYLDFSIGRPSAERVLKIYPHDLVMVRAQSPAFRLMSERPDWKLIYSDAVAALYARADSPTASLLDSPVTSSTAPESSFP